MNNRKIKKCAHTVKNRAAKLWVMGEGSSWKRGTEGCADYTMNLVRNSIIWVKDIT